MIGGLLCLIHFNVSKIGKGVISMCQLKYVVLSLAAMFCISANPVAEQEIAMMKCSRNGDYHNQEDRRRGNCPDQAKCGAPRRYADGDQEDRYQDSRYQEKQHAPKRCSQERCCGGRSCYPDARGKAGYTLDSAGRRRCIPSSTREYKINHQGPCDSKGNCKESAKLEEIRNSPQISEVTIRRKSAAQKVLEGY